MEVTPAGISILVSLPQPKNVPLSISVSLLSFSKVTPLRLKHYSNALIPIVVTPAGIFMFSKPLL